MSKFLRQCRQRWQLFVFLIPAVVYILIFAYYPMAGVQIAFRNYTPRGGIWNSPWVGMKHFNRFFSSFQFQRVLKNTLLVSFYNLIVNFPLALIMSLAINTVRNIRFKKVVQTITYMPHFISVVVLVGMINVFLSPRSGFVNTLLGYLGIKPIFFMGSPAWFKHIYVWSGVWQSAGWSSIIYLAALSGVSPELHEAAIIDGASKLQRIWNIDLPTIMPTMVILLVMSFGSIMNVGYEKVFLLQNSLNMTASEVISTYTYKIGLQDAQYSYSTAIGLFNNVINFAMLVIVNKAAKLLSGSSLW